MYCETPPRSVRVRFGDVCEGADVSTPESSLAINSIRRPGRWDELDRLVPDNPMYDAVIDEVAGRDIRIGRHWLVDFASCNYLGLDLDPEVMAAVDEQIRRWGTHPSWSRLLGSPRLYPQIEERLTGLLGAPDTLVLPTITHIHMSVIPVLAGDGTVFLDRTAHKTIYDGCVYARGLGATLVPFDSADPERLADLLRASAPGNRLVCMDGVNSMTGNLPDLPAIVAVCRDHGALLYVDDAHGFGVIGQRDPDDTTPYGRRGNSIVAHTGESYDDVILVAGFSKAYSSLLAFLALPTSLKKYLKVAAPPYLYSGPSPTASLASTLAGFDINDRRGDALRDTLYRHSRAVLDHLAVLGVQTPNVTGTPIVELPLADPSTFQRVTEVLWRNRIYVTMAAYPLVPHDQVGFRIQLTSAHTDAQVARLNRVLTRLADEGLLRRTRPAPVDTHTLAARTGC
jgi:8-amino-7-oxononanoate synthase